jgi:replication factor C subunit 3/5
MLLSDKYRPKYIDDFKHNHNTCNLIKLVNHNNDQLYLNNMIFHGMSGTGKYSCMMAMLSALYDNSVYNLKTIIKTISTKKNVSFYIRQSKYHIELDLSDYRNNDKHIICDYVNNICKSFNIITGNYRIIVFRNAEFLSKQAQQSLRYIIERHMKTSRFIFIMKTISPLINPIKSRCILYRFSIPTDIQINNILTDIIIKEELTISKNIIIKIIKRCKIIGEKSNLTIAIGLLNEYIVSTDIKNCNIDYINEYNKILKYITTNKQNITNNLLSNIRTTIYLIFTNHNNINYLIQYITYKLIHDDKYTTDMKCKITHNAAKYQHLIVTSNKVVIHIEAFLYSIIGIINDL